MIIAIDAGSPGERDAEHLALTLVPVIAGEALGPRPELIASTHAVRVGEPHGAVTLSWTGEGDPDAWALRVRAALPGPAAVVATRGGAAAPVVTGDPGAVDGALVALALRSLGRDGRLVAYPGQDRLRGTLPVGRVPAVSAVERTELVGGGAVDPDAPLDTRDYVRPVWRDGRIVLQVERAGAGRLQCFEEEHQRPCCADHR